MKAGFSVGFKGLVVFEVKRELEGKVFESLWPRSYLEVRDLGDRPSLADNGFAVGSDLIIIRPISPRAIQGQLFNPVVK